jgi:hypothetical protein
MEKSCMHMLREYADATIAARQDLAKLMAQHPALCVIGPKIGERWCVVLNPLPPCFGYGVLPIDSGPVKDAGGLWAFPHAWLCEALDGRN